ncbi:MAG: OsmC family protein [Burkholderiales bacterium]|jgi:organic hydroperoxide reductase OsmC/OhrA|nr:OsmC family protein [Burkholderiales bacterium]
MAHHFHARITWPRAAGATTATADYTRDYRLSLDGKPELFGSGPTVFKGDAAGLNPEEMLVASLAACHMLTYLALCAHKGVAVIGYEDHGEGKLERVGPGTMKFVEVALKPTVRIAAGSDAKLAEELHHKAHEGCFVANSVNFPVIVAASVEVG